MNTMRNQMSQTRLMPQLRLMTMAMITGLTIVFYTTLAAQAAEIKVTTVKDEVEQNGSCSLREAILSANDDIAVDSCAAGAGADKIVLGAGLYTLAIDGIGDDANLSGDLDVSDDLNLIGADGAEKTIIDGMQIDRVLHIQAGVRIGLAGITVQNGLVGGSNGLGGGLLAEAGAVSLSGVRFIDNNAGRGGALYVNNMLTIRNSSFIGNEAGEGGAIYHSTRGKAQIVNTLFANNHGQKGSVYFLASGALADTTILHTTIASDSAEVGSAIDINGGSASIVNTIITSYATAIQANAGKVSASYNLFFDLSAVMEGKGTLIDNGYNLVGKNPAFVDPANGDYRLSSGSAALKHGKPAGILTDFFGTLRPRNSGVDIGFAQMPTVAIALSSK